MKLLIVLILLFSVSSFAARPECESFATTLDKYRDKDKKAVIKNRIEYDEVKVLLAKAPVPRSEIFEKYKKELFDGKDLASDLQNNLDVWAEGCVFAVNEAILMMTDFAEKNKSDKNLLNDYEKTILQTIQKSLAIPMTVITLIQASYVRSIATLKYGEQSDINKQISALIKSVKREDKIIRDKESKLDLPKEKEFTKYTPQEAAKLVPLYQEDLKLAESSSKKILELISKL